MSKDHYIAKTREGAPGQPLFLALHGTGGDENQFFDFAARLLPQATIVSPRGDVFEHGAARFFRRKAEGLYDLEDLSRATEKMTQFILANRDFYEAGLVIGLGFSNGANILANVLIEQPDLVDAAVLMHPLIPFTPKAALAEASRRVLVTAGEQDPICPVDVTRDFFDYLTQQGGEALLEWHPGGHEIRANEIEAIRRFLLPYM